MTTIINLIKADHRNVEALFERYNITKESDVLNEIITELEKHAAAEEAIVYPELPQEMAQHAIEEHDDIESDIEAIHVAETDTDIELYIVRLQADITHHVGEEEAEEGMLAWLEANYDEAGLVSLGEQFAEHKAEL
ncbi:MAG TPA: hemerythrin domain-containing protein [Nitrososphaera sp.]|nr:hemerythrin domain-containing protein [Nitrososphaera sp.]